MEVEMLCNDCGIAANYLTCLKKYGSKPHQLSFDTSTMHIGRCDCCGKEKWVTEDRDYFYPDERAIAAIRRYLRLKAKGNEVMKPEKDGPPCVR